ncbi:MAG TPA: hypothetical protein VL332_12875 [Candidatus Saccharimonadaceae bacterium]|jgi:folate-binding protein YgfZ|nr:hypothetical protein [Candidatus Saccharimonadaceae bacterium]
MEVPSTPPTRVGPGAVLRLEGRDALAVLHRISTAFLEDLPRGEARTTLFCDFRGRLLHRVVVGHAPDGAIWLVRADAPADALIAFVDRHVFREDVAIRDESAAFAVREMVESAGAPSPARFADGRPVRLPVSAGFSLALEPDLPGRPELEPETQRIRAARPRHGHEVTNAFTPFEVGLAHEVHLDKGCFTGQEALMRLITYRSIRRRLVRVSGPGAVPAGALVRAGDDPAGLLTSVAAEGDGWMALAVVKRQELDAERELRLEDGRAIESVDLLPESAPLGRA